MVLSPGVEWDRRIERARELAGAHESTVALLTFYVMVLTAQKTLYDALASGDWRPSGALERDVTDLRPHALALIRHVVAHAPETLASRGDELVRATGAALDDVLLTWWSVPSDREFFPKAVLQPYAQWLADAGHPTIDRGLARADNRCPFCGGKPQVSILTAGREDTGGGRALLCATCLGSWSFRRVVCVACGEEDDRKLGYFHTSELDYLRVDVCESCRSYVKTVDLTRNGLAVPLIDEVVGAPLDGWARDRGYAKVELNLLGF